MTQENEMPREILAYSSNSGDRWTTNQNDADRYTPYIRRAVTKEEAGEALKYLYDMEKQGYTSMTMAVFFQHYDQTIRKLLEAHK